MFKVIYQIYAYLKNYVEQQVGKKEFPCIESTEEFQVGNYLVRMWIDEPEIRNNYDNSYYKNAAEDYKNYPIGAFARAMASIFNVNAVHVRDASTNSGLVVYKNWP